MGSAKGRSAPCASAGDSSKWERPTTARAGIVCTLHQLRHSHATELVNGGVSLTTIRKRLGHQHVQTTLRYAEVSDITADGKFGGGVEAALDGTATFRDSSREG